MLTVENLLEELHGIQLKIAELSAWEKMVRHLLKRAHDNEEAAKTDTAALMAKRNEICHAEVNGSVN